MRYPVALLFDFDGTLADSITAVQHATNDALAESGYPPVDQAGILYGMQYETVRRFSFHSGCNEQGLLELMQERFYEHLSGRAEMVTPYPGVLELLEELRGEGVPLGVVSNNEAKLIRRVIKLWGVTEMFDLVLGEQDFAPRKPDPAGIRQALHAMGSPPSRAAYVGDSDSDAKAGRDAGVYTIGVNWAHRKYGLTPAAWFPRSVESVEELRKRLRWWIGFVSALPAPVADGIVRKKLYVARHCESEANRRNILAARRDFPLSHRGASDAGRIADGFLREHSLDRIISSPLSRARQTADAFSNRSGVAVEKHDALLEHNLGVFSGLSKRDIAARGDYPENKSGRWRWRPSGGETYEEIYERVIVFMLETVIGGPGESILLTTHAVTMRMIRAFLENSAPLYPEEIAGNGEIWEVDYLLFGRAHPVRELFY